jgi:hypothetical protein
MLTIARLRESTVHVRVKVARIIRQSVSRNQSNTFPPFFGAVSLSPNPCDGDENENLF